MTDFERILNIYSDYALGLRSKNDEKKTAGRGPVELLRVDYWYEGLKQRTGLGSAYAMELYFENESFKRNANGTIRHYRSKWSRYEQNTISPKAKTLATVEQLAPGSTHEINHPLWQIMDSVDKDKETNFDEYFKILSFDIQAVLFSGESVGISTCSIREPVTQLLLDKLERRAGLDALACLIAIMLEAKKRQRKSLMPKVALVLHNVLLIVAIELESRGVGSRILDWIIRNILPLGLLPHLDLWMTSNDYIHASAYLNLMVYQNPQRRGKRLPWKARVKVMGQLMHGAMGFDVQHAMRPQFELRSDIGEIPAEISKEFEQATSLRTWGWTCIRAGKVEPFPSIHDARASALPYRFGSD
ncbi:hypothetical protein SAMN05444506_104277 [Pseudomonas syringae]|uniref:hypothetical protein n=1 Tax=Pseudomonas syringae group TaxID=136849 RepID=UPI000447A486|nr:MULTISPECIES: hypothetical protein [Pseudomonas syringae group]AKF47403.1 hypothetical protein PsyrB_19720 [Pseudomonas syringae pv. syringae B301D]AKF48549.1 hypothetical protein PsyrB_25630 [Pseudomonas syringae pv. syringae B301D]EXL30084.1 hypothetical protein PssB301D_03722 [Pseudomonas syringae pv. syringae str. B301D-R]RMN39627.1 hypothetical protein ALQ59_200099 [Pseudomonas syringae pv. apii]RMN55018.1 hypothetical protein ALQ58_200465 [Pseudomonas syringae pv. apii]